MKTFLGIAAGFLFIPAILGVGALWVWVMMELKISKADFSIGATIALFLLIIGFVVAVKMFDR